MIAEHDALKQFHLTDVGAPKLTSVFMKPDIVAPYGNVHIGNDILDFVSRRFSLDTFEAKSRIYHTCQTGHPVILGEYPFDIAETFTKEANEFVNRSPKGRPGQITLLFYIFE